MVDPARRSPFALRAADLARLSQLTGGAAAAVEAPFLTQVDVRASDPAAAGLPSVPSTWAPLEGAEALWLGPDEWLLVGDSVPPGAASVVDVSANRAVVDLTGPGVREFLSKGCSLDLHPDHWADGACAQTMLAKAPVVLQQRGDLTRVFVRPSFADYLVEWFLAAARG